MSTGNGVAGLPLASLRIFDVTARHLNMGRAAKELGITQGAISRQVKALEDRLQERLFRRGPRGLRLTEAGDLLADYVRRGLDQLETGLLRIGQPRSRTTLLVNAPRSFAMRVLAPRIGDFIRRHPWIDFRLESHRYFAQLHGTDVDVAIRTGDGNWPGHLVKPLTQEVMFPVCSPELWTLQSRHLSPQDFLARHTLLHYSERPHWAAWLKVAGIDPALAGAGPRFDGTALALAAAEAGQGIAIAWRILVAQALADGRLVRPFAPVLEDGTGYHLVMTEIAAGRSTVQAFLGWLRGSLADAQGTVAPHPPEAPEP